MHPWAAWAPVLRRALLLAAPVVPAVLLRDARAFWAGALPLLAAAAAVAAARWRLCWYARSRRGAAVFSGLWKRREFRLPRDAAFCALRFPLFAGWFGAAEACASFSPAGRAVKLALPRRALLRWLKSNAPRAARWRKTPARRTLLAAAFGSSPASGLLLLAVFFQRAARVLGEETPSRWLQAVNPTAYFVALGLPPAAAAAGFVLTLGWAAAFLRRAAGTSGLSSCAAGKWFWVSAGFPARACLRIEKRRVAAVSVSQTLPMALCGVAPVLLHLPGRPRGREPLWAVQRGDAAPACGLFPLPAQWEAELRPAKGSWMRALTPPACEALLWLAFWALLSRRSALLGAAASFLAVFPLWHAAARLWAWRRSGVRAGGGFCEICAWRGFRSVRLWAPVSALREVSVSQTPFQRLRGRATLRISLPFAGWRPSFLIEMKKTRPFLLKYLKDLKKTV